MLFPGINGTRGRHKGSSAPGVDRGVGGSLGVAAAFGEAPVRVLPF